MPLPISSSAPRVNKSEGDRRGEEESAPQYRRTHRTREGQGDCLVRLGELHQERRVPEVPITGTEGPHQVSAEDLSSGGHNPQLQGQQWQREAAQPQQVAHIIKGQSRRRERSLPALAFLSLKISSKEHIDTSRLV
jgi:hypothetical protein